MEQINDWEQEQLSEQEQRNKWSKPSNLQIRANFPINEQTLKQHPGLEPTKQPTDSKWQFQLNGIVRTNQKWFFKYAEIPAAPHIQQQQAGNQPHRQNPAFTERA